MSSELEENADSDAEDKVRRRGIPIQHIKYRTLFSNQLNEKNSSINCQFHDNTNKIIVILVGNKSIILHTFTQLLENFCPNESTLHLPTLFP